MCPETREPRAKARRIIPGAEARVNIPRSAAYVAPKPGFDMGRLADVASKGYEFVEPIAPAEGDILLPKKHPSAFFGAPLASHLVISAPMPWS